MIDRQTWISVGILIAINVFSWTYQPHTTVSASNEKWTTSQCLDWSSEISRSTSSHWFSKPNLFIISLKFGSLRVVAKQSYVSMSNISVCSFKYSIKSLPMLARQMMSTAPSPLAIDKLNQVVTKRLFKRSSCRSAFKGEFSCIQETAFIFPLYGAMESEVKKT